jgi:hypothetical protein
VGFLSSQRGSHRGLPRPIERRNLGKQDDYHV